MHNKYDDEVGSSQTCPEATIIQRRVVAVDLAALVVAALWAAIVIAVLWVVPFLSFVGRVFFSILWVGFVTVL